MEADVIDLIGATYEPDSIGNQQAVENKRQIFCTTESGAREEFYKAGTANLHPRYKFTVFFGDYSGEREVEYRGNRYQIYRTYQAGDQLEIYVTERVGTAEGAAP